MTQNLRLKFEVGGVDIWGVRIDRLELETASNRVDLRLHPRITFVTGLGANERQALGTEILDSLRHGHPGLSVDVVEADGRLIEVYRPLDGSPTVRDAVTGADLTDQYLHYGTVDLLSAIPRPNGGQEVAEGELLRVRNRTLGTQPTGAAEATEPAQEQSFSDQVINGLACLDQDILWATAIVLAETEVELVALKNPTEPDPPRPYEDALRDLVEERHDAVQLAADLLESDRVLHLSVAVTLTLIATIGAVLVSPYLAIPFLLAASAAGSVSVWRWRQLIQASQSEVEALEAAGLTCYLKLRMSELDEEDQGQGSQREQLDEIHALAIQAWINLVGSDVSLEWAVLNRRHIQDAAEKLSQTSGGQRDVRSESTSGDSQTDFDAFLPWLHQHLERVASQFNQSVPVVIDHCFASSASSSLSTQEISMVADLLALHSRGLQLIVMTDNPELMRRFPTSSDQASILRLGRESLQGTDHSDLVDLTK